jgi:hypothetical protein
MLLRRHSRDLLKVLTAADIRRAKAERKIGLIYGFQNGAMMGKDPAVSISSPIWASAFSSSPTIPPTNWRRIDGAGQSRADPVRPRSDRAAQRQQGDGRSVAQRRADLPRGGARLGRGRSRSTTPAAAR